jgi:hypothetical protein
MLGRDCGLLTFPRSNGSNSKVPLRISISLTHCTALDSNCGILFFLWSSDNRVGRIKVRFMACLKSAFDVSNYVILELRQLPSA